MHSDKITIAFSVAALTGLIAGGIYLDRKPDNAEIEKALLDKGYHNIEITDPSLQENFKTIFSCGKYERKMHIQALDAQGRAASGISCQDKYSDRMSLHIVPN